MDNLETFKLENFPSTISFAAQTNIFLDELAKTKKIDDEVIKKLEEIKRKMLEFGFNAPFRAILQQTKSELVENSSIELVDQKKQNQYIRYLASFKKFTLNRVGVAYAASKLKKYLESTNYNFLIDFLPYGGEYKEKILDYYALEAYLYLQNIFRSIKYEVKPSKLISIDKNYKLFTKKSSLIKKHAAKVALFCAIANYAANKAKNEVEILYNDDEEIKKYNDILKNFGFEKDVVLNFEKYPPLKTALAQNGFFNDKKRFVLSAEFEAKLNKKRNLKRNKTLLYASQTAFDLLFEYYLFTNEQIRQSSCPFYSVVAKPTLEQLAVFNELKVPTSYVQSPVEILEEKFDLEKKEIPLNQKLLGIGFLNFKKSLDPEFVYKKFSIKKEELEHATELIRKIYQEPKGQLSVFLESLKENEEEKED